MQQKMYGYIRVSTREQNEERQRIALLEMGVPKERIYVDLNEQWRRITKEKGADIVVIDMPILDTRREKNLMGTFISDIVLALLSYVAESERHNIKQRQEEGIRAAKQRGVRFGRPQKPLPENFKEAYQRWNSGELIGKQAAVLCDMPLSTFYKRANQFREIT